MIMEAHSPPVASESNTPLLRGISTPTYLTDVISEVLYVLDLEGKVAWCNQSLATATGRSVRQLQEQPLVQLFPETKQPHVQEALNEALHEGTASFQAALLTAAGSATPYRFSTVVIRNAKGRIVGLAGSGRDVSEHLRHEQTAQIYRAAFTHVADVVFITDETGAFTYVSPNVETLFGHTPEEVQDLDRIDALLDANLFDPAILRSKGVLRDLECEVTDKEGGALILSVTVKHLSLDNGSTLYACRDITEQKRALRVLHIQKHALAAISSGITICDAQRPTLPIVYCNPAFEAITGYRQEEILGRNCRFLQGPETNPEAVQAIREALTARHGCRVKLQNYRKDGTPFWNELTLSPVRGPKGIVTHFIGVQIDVTQRHEAEEKLEKNQAYLIQTEKMASLGQLAAGIAHEVNNPIGFLISNLETFAQYTETLKHVLATYTELADAVRCNDFAAQQDALADADQLRAQEDLDFILHDLDLLLAKSLNGTERVKEIVQHLRSFARVHEAEMQDADLNEGIEATLRMVWNELKHKCTVHKKLSPLPPLRCHAGRLNQVFLNLLINAAQAIPEAGDITIETEATDEALIVRITDTGVGISEENRSKLFDPFFTTKPVDQGTGLGLSISYGIVQDHGGEIEVDSEEGVGTTFTVRLPRRPT